MVHLRPKQSEGLLQLIQRYLDKGIVIDSKVRLSLFDVHLVKMRAMLMLASFNTAAKHGLDFPSEVMLENQAWRKLLTRETCPQCNKFVSKEELKKGCPWCGYELGLD